MKKAIALSLLAVLLAVVVSSCCGGAGLRHGRRRSWDLAADGRSCLRPVPGLVATRQEETQRLAAFKHSIGPARDARFW